MWPRNLYSRVGGGLYTGVGGGMYTGVGGGAYTGVGGGMYTGVGGGMGYIIGSSEKPAFRMLRTIGLIIFTQNSKTHVR